MNASTPPPTRPRPAGRTQLDVFLHVPVRTAVVVATFVALFLLGLSAAHRLQTLLVQLLVAAFVAVAADSLVRRLERVGLSRGQSVSVVMLSLAILVMMIAAVFVPPIVEQGQRLVDRAPGYVADIQHSKVYRDLDGRFHVVETATRHLEQAISSIPERIGSIAGRVVGGVFTVITFLFMVTFLLLGGADLARGTLLLFPHLTQRTWWSVMQGAYRNIGSYVLGALSIATIAGVSMTIVLAIVGTPFALPLGLWMLLLDLIPLVGATLGALPAIAVTFLTGGVVRGLIVLAFVIVYQQMENVVIQPRIQGRVASLSALVIFLSVLVGSNLLGVVGALFAVPVASIVAIVLRQYLELTGRGRVVIPAFHDDAERLDD